MNFGSNILETLLQFTYPIIPFFVFYITILIGTACTKQDNLIIKYKYYNKIAATCISWAWILSTVYLCIGAYYNIPYDIVIGLEYCILTAITNLLIARL